MTEGVSEKRGGRVGVIKKVIIALAVFLLVFPNIVSVILLVRQSEIQARVDYLAKEMANMKLGTYGDLGRIESGRLALLDAYPEMFAPDGMQDSLTAVADASGNENTPDDKVAERLLPVSEDVSGGDVLTDDYVWSFSSSGEVDEAAHKVYLTFDDGPSDYTDDILDILDEYGVKATFFVVGKEKDSDIELYKRIVEEGHTLGMHSYSHVYSKIYASEENFTDDLDRISDLLLEATGVQPQFYRFPGGSSNAVSSLDMHRFINILDDRGITYFDWNVSSGDATNELLSADRIYRNSINGIENRSTSVILMHDSLVRPTTVQALPMIIEKILSMEDTAILPITSDTELIRHIE